MQQTTAALSLKINQLVNEVFGDQSQPLMLGHFKCPINLIDSDFDNFDLFLIEYPTNDCRTEENESHERIQKWQKIASFTCDGMNYWLYSKRLFNRYAAGISPRIISYYTKNTPYEQCAERLKYSLLNNNYHNFDIVGIEDTGNWEENCSLKPIFILQQLLKHRKPVMWVDADARIVNSPIIPAGTDFAVHLFDGWEFASGTIFFDYNESAIALLNIWAKLCRIKPLIWDQMLLDEAWAKTCNTMCLKTLWLPEGYTYIYDRPELQGVDPITIAHYQQSRKVVEKRPKPKVPESLKIARRMGKLGFEEYPDVSNEPCKHSTTGIDTIRWPNLNLKFDFLLERLYKIRTSEKRRICFLQVGAMDGKRFDPIFQRVKDQGWEGVLLEPLSDMFSLLRENYDGCKQLSFINAAIDTQSGEREIYRVSKKVVDEGILPEWALGVSSFYNDRNALGGKQVDNLTKKLLSKHMVKEKVNCITFEEVFDLYPSTLSLDVLLIDTEGHDLKVLNAFPFDTVKPLIVEFEYYNLPTAEFDQALRLIEKHGYAYTMNNKDVTASLMRFPR